MAQDGYAGNIIEVSICVNKVELFSISVIITNITYPPVKHILIGI